MNEAQNITEEEIKELYERKLKPLDLSNLLKHAFLSGFVAAKNLPAHEPYNGIESWVEYDPSECSAYNRINEALKKDK